MRGVVSTVLALAFRLPPPRDALAPRPLRESQWLAGGCASDAGPESDTMQNSHQAGQQSPGVARREVGQGLWGVPGLAYPEYRAAHELVKEGE